MVFSLIIYLDMCPTGHRLAGICVLAKLDPCIRACSLVPRLWWPPTPTPQLTRARVGASSVVFSLIIYLDMCPTGHRLAGICVLAKLDPCIRACPLVPRLWWPPTPTPQLTRARVAASSVVFSLIIYLDMCPTGHRVAGVCVLAKLIR